MEVEGNVAGGLPVGARHLTRGVQDVHVCGARGRGHAKGELAGTVKKLLIRRTRHVQCTLVMRVGLEILKCSARERGRATGELAGLAC